MYLTCQYTKLHTPSHIYIDILYRVSCTKHANIQYYIHSHIYIDILYRVSCTKHANIQYYIQAHIYIHIIQGVSLNIPIYNITYNTYIL